MSDFINNIKRMIDKKHDSNVKTIYDKNCEYNELVLQIKKLEPDIKDLIKAANYAEKRGVVRLNADCEYENGGFISDSVYHHFGFIRVSFYSSFKYIGIMNGGYCGEWSFMTNGKHLIESHGKTDMTRNPSIDNMRKFIKMFPEFKEKFYEYLKNECEIGE